MSNFGSTLGSHVSKLGLTLGNLRSHELEFRFQSLDSSNRDGPIKVRVLVSDALAKIRPHLHRINYFHHGSRSHSIVEIDARKVMKAPTQFGGVNPEFPIFERAKTSVITTTIEPHLLSQHRTGVDEIVLQQGKQIEVRHLTC